LEEGSEVRRQTIESASSLSVSRNEAFPSPTILFGRVLKTLGSR
jgi:hypothetical protein